jgi:hypothetical protein
MFSAVVGAGKTSDSGQCSYIAGSYAVFNLFFCLGGGQLLHNVLKLILWGLMKDSNGSLTTSSTVAFLSLVDIYLASQS